MFKDIKLLDRVIGNHPERNLTILQLVADGFEQKNVARQFNLSEGSITVIKKANQALFNELCLTTGLAGKSEQILYAKRQLRKKESNSSVKDSLDWLQLVVNLTKEDKSLIDNSTHYHFDLKQGEKIVAEARRRGIPIPETLARRFGDTAQIG
jgi:hypothetical protein